MSDYKFIITIDSIPTEFNPLTTGFSLNIERTDVKNRFLVNGSLKFGGQDKGDEFDALVTKIDFGKLPILIQERNFDTDIFEDYASGSLIMDGEYNIDTKEVSLQVEIVDTYTQYYLDENRELSTKNTTVPASIGIDRNKWNLAVNCSLYSYFEFQYRATIPDGAGWESFIPAGSGILAAYAREGVLAQKNPTIDLTPPTFLDNWEVEGNRSYKDWSTRNPSLQTHAIFFAGGEKPSPQDDWIFVFDVDEGTRIGSYWIQKSNINYTPYPNTYKGARRLDDVLNDLLLNRSVDILSLSELTSDPSFANAIVVPSGSVLLEDDFENISIDIVNELLETLVHAYIRIDQPFVSKVASYKLIKDITYPVEGLDLTVIQSGSGITNFAKNRSKFSTNVSDKPPRIIYEMTGENTDFKSQDVVFNLGIPENEPETIKIDKWVSDIRDCQQGDSSRYKGKFFIFSCNESTFDLFSLWTNGVPTIALLNGAPWVSTALTSFTWNGVGQAYTNTISPQAGQGIRILLDSPVNQSGGTIIFTVQDMTDLLTPDVYAFDEINNGALEETFTFPKNNQYRIKVRILSAGDVVIDNFRFQRVEYEVRENVAGLVSNQGILNAEFSLANLLGKFIAEMPYPRANYNGNTDVLVHKAYDRQNVPIKYTQRPTLKSVNLDEYFSTENYKLAAINIIKKLDGSFPEINGWITADISRNRITEEDDFRITEETDNRVTE